MPSDSKKRRSFLALHFAAGDVRRYGYKMIETDYIGKLILIGISFVSKDDELIEQFQTHGYIEKIEENGLMRVRRDSLPIFTIPFDEESISKAEPGIYRERATGIEIANPDFLTSWSVHQSQKLNIERYKEFGFEEFIPNEKTSDP